MQVLQAPKTIRYSITPCPGGFNLSLWETAGVNESRVKPFLFKINYRLASQEEAQQLLHYCLEQLN